jgi:hypothetical protein
VFARMLRESRFETEPRQVGLAAGARDLQAVAEVADAAQPGLGADLSALALISLGSTELWGRPRPRTPRASSPGYGPCWCMA